MIDITKYPGAIIAINKLLSAGRDVEVRMEDDAIAVAEHIRIFEGQFSSGQNDKNRR